MRMALDTLESLGIIIKKKCTREQYAVMVRFMEENPLLLKNASLQQKDRSERRRLWNCLAEQLNSVPQGPSKTVGKWIRCWVDYKHDLKRRHFNSKNEPMPNARSFDEMEKRALALFKFMAPPCHRKKTCQPEAEDSDDDPSDVAHMIPLIKQELVAAEDPSLQEATYNNSTIIIPHDLVWSGNTGPTVLQIRSADPDTPSPHQRTSTGPHPQNCPRPQQPKTSGSSRTAQQKKKEVIGNPSSIQANGHSTIGSSEQMQGLVEAQEASAVSLSSIAAELKRRNDLEEQRLQVENRKACAFEAMAQYYRAKCEKLQEQ